MRFFTLSFNITHAPSFRKGRRSNRGFPPPNHRAVGGKTHSPALYPREVIIVDNKSTSPLVLPSALATGALPVTLLRCPRPGPASARNVGVQHTRTEWVLFIDSDCLPTSTMLSAMNGAVGYADAVQALGQDRWSRYYDSQAILISPLRSPA